MAGGTPATAITGVACSAADGLFGLYAQPVVRRTMADCIAYDDIGNSRAGTGRGRPSSSIATKVKVASVTFSCSVVRKRLAQASTWIFIEVRPTDSISV